MFSLLTKRGIGLVLALLSFGSIPAAHAQQVGQATNVRVVATQCASGADTLAGYAPAAMADDAVVERLQSSTLDEQSIAAIVGALRRGSVHVSKQVYAHDLAGGDSVVYAVARNGQLIERPAAKVAKVGGVPHRLMLETLATGLAHDPARAAG